MCEPYMINCTIHFTNHKNRIGSKKKTALYRQQQQIFSTIFYSEPTHLMQNLCTKHVNSEHSTIYSVLILSYTCISIHSCLIQYFLFWNIVSNQHLSHLRKNPCDGTVWGLTTWIPGLSKWVTMSCQWNPLHLVLFFMKHTGTHLMLAASLSPRVSHLSPTKNPPALQSESTSSCLNTTSPEVCFALILIRSK